MELWLKCAEVGENIDRKRLGLFGVVESSPSVSAIGAAGERYCVVALLTAVETEGDLSSSPYEERRRSQSGREEASRDVTRCTADFFPDDEAGSMSCCS